MNIGDRVICTEYIKPSGNHYEILSEKETETRTPTCTYWKHGSDEALEVEDCHDCERYKTIPKEFTGVYVGMTTLCTRLNAEWYENDYGGCGFRTYCDKPKKFAIVYYADNKKRLVPYEKITMKEENENA